MVTGNVTDPFGKGIGSAAVTVEGTSFSTTTNNEGEYSIQFVPGQFKVRIAKDGCTTSTLPFNVTEATRVPAAAVVLYPRPTEFGIYYVGKEKLEALTVSRLRREKVSNPIVWLPGTTRYLLQEESSLVLPEGEARFIDTVPRAMQLARATSRSGLILDTANGDAAGFIKATAEKVGAEELTVWTVQLQPGIYGWIELKKNLLGEVSPGEAYYGFRVGDARQSSDHSTDQLSLPNEGIDDKDAQKKTIADIRNIGTAMFSWVTDQASAGAAGQPQTPEGSKMVALKKYPLISHKELEAILIPQYLQSIHKTDGWGHPYEFYLNAANPLAKEVMSIRSPGRDGRFSATDYTIGGFAPDNFDEDIVWSDGFFVRWPQAQ